jgi:hypothetical protein
MINIFKASVIGLIIAMILLSGSHLYCKDGELKTFRGAVVEVDWVGSLLTVEGEDEVTFYVPPETRIMNRTEMIGLFDIEQNDNVFIKYYDDPSGPPKTVSINVETSYPSF